MDQLLNSACEWLVNWGLKHLIIKWVMSLFTYKFISLVNEVC